MALQQIIQHPTGTYSQYWKIRSVTLNHTEGTGSITVDGYVSQQAREEGRVPLDSRTVQITEYSTRFAPAVIDEAGMNEVKAAYIFLKTLVLEFQGSVDV